MRRMLTFQDRVQIAVGVTQGLSDRQIGVLLQRDHTIVWRERRRNALTSGAYKPVSADFKAAGARHRPQTRAVDADPVLRARVLADLRYSRTPRQIAGRLRLEATDATVVTMTHSPDAGGRTVSHEAIYRWIYAHPKGELKKQGILLRSKRTARKPRRDLGQRTESRIVGMVSIDDRPDDAALRVPGAWEGDLIIGKANKSAAATLVERNSRFVIILGLPDGKQSQGIADVLIDRVNDMPRHLRGSLTWDQGTEMANHAKLTMPPIYPSTSHTHDPRGNGPPTRTPTG